jgi:hypothetical protein
MLTALSWTPGWLMPQRGPLSPQDEHLLAYFLGGFLVMLALNRSLTYGNIGLCLVGFAGTLEIGQAFIPERSPDFSSFLASAGGGLAGVFVAWLLMTFARLVPSAILAGRSGMIIRHTVVALFVAAAAVPIVVYAYNAAHRSGNVRGGPATSP